MTDAQTGADQTVAALADIELLRERAERSELGVYARMPVVPVRGEGCYLFDAHGERYLDFYGGHAVALTGHCHPTVVDAIVRQARELLFYSSAVHSPVRVAASELLLRHAPHPDSRVFHCCSGAEANEVAFKIARKATGRPNIVSFEGSFHGRTIGALSAAGMEKYRATAGPVLVEEHKFVPFGDVEALRNAVDGDTAAIVCETIQSLAGVHAVPDDFFTTLASIAAQRGALTIFDEVQSGLGRTGTFFFADGVGVRPDLITLAKGIASGVPAGAVVVAPHLAALAALGDHGSTFGGGPVAMAAMRATLEVIEDEGLVTNAQRMGRVLRDAITSIAGVKQLRGKGLLLGIELARPARPIQSALLDRKVITGTSAQPEVLRLLPPLIVGEAEVGLFTDALHGAIDDA